MTICTTIEVHGVIVQVLDAKRTHSSDAFLFMNDFQGRFLVSFIQADGWKTKMFIGKP